MPFYVGDYLRDTMHLTREQHGAYLLLLFACWSANGQLPNNDDVLASIAKATENEWLLLKPFIANFFQISRHFWRHKRVDLELHKTEHLHDVRKKAGKKGNEVRWQTPRKAIPRARVLQPQPQPYLEPEREPNGSLTPQSPPSRGGRAHARVGGEREKKSPREVQTEAFYHVALERRRDC